MCARDCRCRPFRLDEQCRNWNTFLVLLKQFIRIDFHANRIHPERVALHVGVRLFRICIAINLKLHPIAVRVPVINGERYTMVHTPIGRDAELF